MKNINSKEVKNNGIDRNASQQIASDRKRSQMIVKDHKMSEENVKEPEATEELTIEQKVAAKPITAPVTPYQIALYLKEVLEIDIAPQRVYRDRSDGRLAAHRANGAKDGKWMVKQQDAMNYSIKIAKGSSKTVNPW